MFVVVTHVVQYQGFNILLPVINRYGYRLFHFFKSFFISKRFLSQLKKAKESSRWGDRDLTNSIENMGITYSPKKFSVI